MQAVINATGYIKSISQACTPAVHTIARHIHNTDVLCNLPQKSTPNLEGAFKYLKQHVGNEPFSPEVVRGLDEAAGVGVVITPQQIAATVDRHISKVKAQLQEQRYKAV